jgi:hypothetical protein
MPIEDESGDARGELVTLETVPGLLKLLADLRFW